MLNPYIVDRPLAAQDPFFGRERLLTLLAQLFQSEQRLFLLFGERHIGKTSLLNQLPAYLGEGYRVVRVAWEDDTENSGALLPRILLAVADALDWTAPELGSTKTKPADLRAYLQEREASLDSSVTPLVCIDGIPAALCGPGSGWAALVTSLAQLLHGGRLALLLSIEARPAECEPCDAVPNPITLGGLSLEDTEDLLLMSTRGQLTYDLDSMRRVHTLTGGEPFLVQLFGHALFERRASRGWVNLPEVDAVVESVIEQAAPQFVEIWSRSSVAARVVLCVFAEGLGTHGIGSADDIRRRLERLRVDVPLGHIEQALAELYRRDMVERLGGGMVRFRSALLLQWLRANKSALETVRRSREYRRLPIPTVPPLLSTRVDWLGLGLWVAIAALILAIGAVWRGRELRIEWTDQPPTVEPQVEATAPLIVPTSEPPLLLGRIAYMAKQEPGDFWAIYTMSAEGLDPVSLTAADANDMQPTWSPDGRRIAFVSDRDGNREIYVMQADGSEQINLTQNAAEDWTPTWSPDGARLAFASFRDGNWEVYTMQADGSGQTRLTRSPGADYSPAWSPDGEWIAFVSGRTGNLEIFVMRPDGSEVRQFSSDPATDQSPCWSYDGEQLLWESYRYDNMEIMIADLADVEPRNLSQDTYANDHGPSMCPLGRRIAYFTNRDGGWDIVTLDLETGERVNLTQGIAIEQSPAWAP